MEKKDEFEELAPSSLVVLPSMTYDLTKFNLAKKETMILEILNSIKHLLRSISETALKKIKNIMASYSYIIIQRNI